MRSRIAHTVGWGVLQDLCPTFELPAVDSVSEITAECKELDAITIEWEYKGKRTDFVPGFLVDLGSLGM